MDYSYGRRYEAFVGGKINRRKILTSRCVSKEAMAFYFGVNLEVNGKGYVDKGPNVKIVSFFGRDFRFFNNIYLEQRKEKVESKSMSGKMSEE